MKSGEKAVVVLDLRGVVCPMNFVKIKLAMEDIEPGDCLEALVDEGEPMRNVPRSIKAEGHKILEVHRENGWAKLLIRKGEE